MSACRLTQRLMHDGRTRREVHVAVGWLFDTTPGAVATWDRAYRGVEDPREPWAADLMRACTRDQLKQDRDRDESTT